MRQKRLSAHDRFRAAWADDGWGGADDLVEDQALLVGRDYRFDFAWPAAKVAVEIHGFGWGHQAQQNVARDAEKTRLAILQGWTVLPFTTRCLGSRAAVQEAVEVVREVIARQMQVVEFTGGSGNGRTRSGKADGRARGGREATARD